MNANYKNILVAIDGSKSAEAAFEKAVSIAKDEGATLHLINVIDTRLWAQIEAQNQQNVERDAKAFSESLLNGYEEAIAAGIENIQLHAEYGSPRTVITKKVVPELNIDLLVCGATGVSTSERVLLGSVSEAIVRTATCDTLIVRAAQ